MFVTESKLREFFYKSLQLFKNQELATINNKLKELEDFITKQREVINSQQADIRELQDKLHWLEEDINVIAIQKHWLYPDKPKLTIGKALSALYKHLNLEVDLTGIAVVEREKETTK